MSMIEKTPIPIVIGTGDDEYRLMLIPSRQSSGQVVDNKINYIDMK